MKEKRKQDEQRATDASKPQRERDQAQPKKQDEEPDEQALDEVLRDCPL